MRNVKALLESAETQSLLQENVGLVQEASNALSNFYGVLNNYIAENLVEFLDENLEETAKNIYVRSQVNLAA